ncbi:MAG: glycerol kinase GlpK [Planctomycetes bacterium]|nr:glycerol kinase GlpK [Planctomycetota bacterium]
MTTHILAIDQGTTSSRALIFDAQGLPIAIAQRELEQCFPKSGWVEHDPIRIWQATLHVCREALKKSGLQPEDVATIGITNQRETVVVWDKVSGLPVHPAIVWQDRRTAPQCEDMRDQGLEESVRAKTGLLLDPYFSATKLTWLLDHIPGLRQRADQGEVLAGTIDSWLLWNLTKGGPDGAVHATDVSNASRTSLFDIHRCAWDEELLHHFGGIPKNFLPIVRPSGFEFGSTHESLFGTPIPIRGILGDQQAATFGQACFQPGMSKCTFGTGCFTLVNTGEKPVASSHQLLSTIGWKRAGKTQYALEGAVFSAGSAVKWLRDGLGVIQNATETEALAESARDIDGLFFIPAFTGLGAPWWDAHARGGIVGLTRDTGRNELVRATLDAVCWQTVDLLQAMVDDGAPLPESLRVDGGMVANDWFLQRLADLSGLNIQKPTVLETTAFGAAGMAGLEIGLWADTDALSAQRSVQATFSPAWSQDQRVAGHTAWHSAIQRVLTS